MKRAILLLALLACGGPGAKSPQNSAATTKPIADAVQVGANDPNASVTAFSNVLLSAASEDSNPWQIWALGAAIDPMVLRSTLGFGSGAELLYVTADPRVTKQRGALEDALERASAAARGPFARGIIAWAGERVAQQRGDATKAAAWRKARGCAGEATVIGPLSWAPVSGVSDKDPLEDPLAKLEGTYAGDGPFAKTLHPLVVRGQGCWLSLEAESALQGVRDVVVDLEVPAAQTIGVALRTEGTATLRVGGKLVLDRPFTLGGAPVTRFAKVEVEKGRVRVVARVGADQQGEAISIHAWDKDGAPLEARAPKVGEAATARATGGGPVATPNAPSDTDAIALAAGMLAFGEAKGAERVLHDRPNAPPAALLLRARATLEARDLTQTRRAERARALWDRVLEQWPGSWEAVIAHAELAGDRKGRSEARMAALQDLDAHRAQVKGAGAALVDAYDAMTSGQEGLYDRARAALDRAKGPLAGTALLRDVTRAAIPRSGTERIIFECGELQNEELTCYDALADAGEWTKAESELERVRQVRGAPTSYLGYSLRSALARNDLKKAREVLATMPPGERTFAAFAALCDVRPGPGPLRCFAAPNEDKPGPGTSWISSVAAYTSDNTQSIAAMLRWLGQDSVAAFDGVAERVIKADRDKPAAKDAGTAVLEHDEKWSLDELGLLHVTMLDVRRVGGTTDVEENAQASAFEIAGRSTSRALRKRIFKKDGRVLTPDPTPNAAQAHADLAQLEKGDAIEVIYEAWGLPQVSGELGGDTPDLLPERTAVVRAEIELRLPASLDVSLWSHPLLGAAKESKEGAQRVLVWKLADKPTRRIEEGTPKMDRGARVAWSTTKWSTVARGMREALAALDDRDAEVEAWAKEAGKGKTGRELVEAVVARAGETVRESNAGLLSDYMLLRSAGPQQYTARTILSEREGSRTWLILRALRALGVSADLGVAENEPYSSDPSFPAHYGRFTHPLALARVANKEGKEEDIWIDADVSGPPLPAGRVSPELRGRTVLLTDGKMIQTPSGAENDRDEIDLRLALDASGDAKGTLTVLLRGRAAQEISEAMLRVVGFERERALRNIALAWLPFADIESVALSSNEGSWQVALRADVSVKRYAQPEGKGADATWVLPGLEPLHTVFPRPWVTTLAATYAGQGARQEALAINRAVQWHAHRRIELPPGATVVRAPSPLEVRTPNLNATRKLTSGQVLEEEFVLTVTTGTVPANRYTAFVTDAQKIDAAFLASTRVKPSK